jgi:hypothetical protein
MQNSVKQAIGCNNKINTLEITRNNNANKS